MYNTNIRYFHLTFIRVQLAVFMCLFKRLKSNATELCVEEREFRPGENLLTTIWLIYLEENCEKDDNNCGRDKHVLLWKMMFVQ